MSDTTLKKQQVPHQASTPKTSSIEDLGQELDQQLAAIPECLTEAFVALDREWHVPYTNHQPEPLFPQTREALLGKVLWEAVSEVGLPFYQKYPEALETPLPVYFEELYRALNKWFQIHTYSSVDEIVGFFQDITQHKRTAELLTLATIVESSDDAIIARDISERKLLGQRKDDFVSMASHELKNSLTTLNAYTQLLQRMFEKEVRREASGYLSEMQTQITKLSKLVADLLDISNGE